MSGPTALRCWLLLALFWAVARADAALDGAPPNGSAAASPGRELLDQALRCFDQGVQAKQDPNQARKHFVEAAAKFSQLQAAGAHNADLYLNWGNAELLADNVPAAILAYRRGLRLAPGRRDLLDNLALAQARIHSTGGGTTSATDAWLSLIPWLPAYLHGMLFAATVLAYALACLSLATWLKLRPGRLPGRAMLLLVLTAACAFFWHREHARLQHDLDHPLVVMKRETPLVLGNGPSYPPHPSIATLQAGMEARRLGQRGGWLQIQLAGGAIGWVPATAALVDD